MKPVFDHRCERSVCGARYLYEFQGRAKIPPRFDRWLFFSPKAVRQLQIFPNSVDHHIVYFHFSAKIHKAAACLGYRSLFYKHKVFAGREQRILIAPSCETPCSCVYNLLHSRRQKSAQIIHGTYGRRVEEVSWSAHYRIGPFDKQTIAVLEGFQHNLQLFEPSSLQPFIPPVRSLEKRA